MLAFLLIPCRLFAFEVDNHLRDQILILSQSLGSELSNSIKQAETLFLDVESYLIDSNLPKPKWVSSSLKGIWMSGLAESEGSQSVVLTDGTIDERALELQASKLISGWEYQPSMGLLVTSRWKGRNIVLALNIEQLSHQISFTKNDFGSLWLLNEKDQIIISARSPDWGKQLAAEIYTEFFQKNPQEDLWIGQIKGSVWSAYRFKVPGSPLFLLGLSKVPTLLGLPPQQVYKIIFGLIMLGSLLLLLWFRYIRSHPDLELVTDRFEMPEKSEISVEQVKLELDNSDLKINPKIEVASFDQGLEFEKTKPTKRRIKAMLPLPPNNLFSDQAIEQAIQALDNLPEVDEPIKPIGSKKNILPSASLGYELDFEEDPQIEYDRPSRDIDSIETAIRKPGDNYDLN